AVAALAAARRRVVDLGEQRPKAGGEEPVHGAPSWSGSSSAASASGSSSSSASASGCGSPSWSGSTAPSYKVTSSAVVVVIARSSWCRAAAFLEWQSNTLTLTQC